METLDWSTFLTLLAQVALLFFALGIGLGGAAAIIMWMTDRFSR